MSETTKRIDALTEKIHANHLEAMTSISKLNAKQEIIASQMEHITSYIAGKPKDKPWYQSKIARGIGVFLAALAAALGIVFKK